MKIIHCADLHLDSRLNTNLSAEKAKERKAELLDTFIRLSDYAEENGVKAVIIAGDLFDKKNVSLHARNTVYGIMERHPDISYLYLRGNHDVSAQGAHPKNLRMFGNGWTYYGLPIDDRKNVIIAGIELNDENSSDIYAALELRAEDINIVTLHGQIGDYALKSRPEMINIHGLKNKSIDYLALGHIHEHKTGTLPPRGEYVYPGCLEGRGFDECGVHGFELIDIDERKFTLTHKFIPFAKRTVHEVRVDVSGVMTTVEIEDLVRSALTDRGISPDDMVKIVLTGKVDVECEKDPEQVRQRFENDYYFLKVSDETGLAVDYVSFGRDASLKGEFVRIVQSDELLSEERKSAIIRCGIQALSGEEWQ